jgi:hypothetical protein
MSIVQIMNPADWFDLGETSKLQGNVGSSRLVELSRVVQRQTGRFYLGGLTVRMAGQKDEGDGELITRSQVEFDARDGKGFKVRLRVDCSSNISLVALNKALSEKKTHDALFNQLNAKKLLPAVRETAHQVEGPDLSSKGSTARQEAETVSSFRSPCSNALTEQSRGPAVDQSMRSMPTTISDSAF